MLKKKLSEFDIITSVVNTDLVPCLTVGMGSVKENKVITFQNFKASLSLSAGGNNVSTISATSLSSPYSLVSGDITANTLNFTGTRSSVLNIYSSVAGSWIVKNSTTQNINFLAASGSLKYAVIKPAEVRVISTDLTDIYASVVLVQQGITTTSLVGYFKNGTGISSGTWVDQSSGAHDATLVNGAAPVTSNGYSGVTFDGTNDQCTIASSLGILSSTGFTLMARAYFTGSQKGSLIKIGGNNSNGASLCIGSGSGMTTNGNNMVLLFSGTTSYAGPTIGTGLHTIAITFTGTSAKFYIDGVLQSGYNTTVGTLVTPTNAATIGGHTESSTPIYFSGAIYDVLMYNAALTDAQVLQNYTSL